MKVVILCGGKGTRMHEETEFRPKPLVLIGGKPILWHIMKYYASFGHTEFILCTGYKGEMIKQYFMEMYWRNNDFTVYMEGDKPITYHTQEEEKWQVTIVDTGKDTLTSGRIKQIQSYVGEERFFLTYGDGLSDVDLDALVQYHEFKKTIGTLTGVHPTSTFGLMEVDEGLVKQFREKPVLKDLVNGGYMVMEKELFDYLPEEDCALEDIPLVNLAKDDQLAVYEHLGFWKAIDTQKDIVAVEKIYRKGRVPWEKKS